MEHKVVVKATRFKGRNMVGDFYWMALQPEYEKTLFIFNDNEEFHDTCEVGGGNAVMRQFNKYALNIPMSAGIPTGTLEQGGYTELTKRTKNVIRKAIFEIKELIQKHKYETVIYAVGENGKLGTAIFDVAPEVIDYIDQLIRGLSSEPVEILN